MSRSARSLLSEDSDEPVTLTFAPRSVFVGRYVNRRSARGAHDSKLQAAVIVDVTSVTVNFGISIVCTKDIVDVMVFFRRSDRMSTGSCL